MNHLLLDHFLAAYEARSMGKAAGFLGLTQPALSKSIRKLESELAVLLFERSTSGILPTPYADALARRGQAIRADLLSVVDELQKMRQGEVGEVKMGVAPALSPHFVPRVLALAQQRHPSLKVMVHEGLYGDLARRVSLGELDFALSNPPFDGSAGGLLIEELFRDRFTVCCSIRHSLAHQKKLRPADLLNWPWVTPGREALMWQHLVDLFAIARCAPPLVTLETNSATLIKALLSDGKSLTFVPRQYVIADLLRGELVELAVPGITLERSIAIMSRPGREHPMAAKLMVAACQTVVERKLHEFDMKSATDEKRASRKSASPRQEAGTPRTTRTNRAA